MEASKRLQIGQQPANCASTKSTSHRQFPTHIGTFHRVGFVYPEEKHGWAPSSALTMTQKSSYSRGKKRKTSRRHTLALGCLKSEATTHSAARSIVTDENNWMSTERTCARSSKPKLVTIALLPMTKHASRSKDVQMC